MNKEELEHHLAAGITLREIGERTGKHLTTVGCWVKKHGLRAVYKDKHAAKGGITREVLDPMVEEGLAVKEMARRLDRSYSTVRHWLTKYGYWPLPATGRRAEARRARERGERYAEMECSTHGQAIFILEGRGYYRCTRCRMERVSEWRRRAKRRLLASVGGSCVICGYDKCPAALQFHHLEPADKRFAISRQGGDPIFCGTSCGGR